MAFQEFIGRSSDDIIYIIRRIGLFGDTYSCHKEKPKLDAYYPEGTEIYEAKVIANFQSRNTV